LRTVLIDVVRLVALAMAAAVQGDELKAGGGFEFGVAEDITAPGTGIAHPAVDEHDRHALAFGDVADLHAVGVEECVVGGQGGGQQKAACKIGEVFQRISLEMVELTDGDSLAKVRNWWQLE